MADGALQRAEPAIESWMGPGPRSVASIPAGHAGAAPLPPIDVVVRGDVPHGDIPYVHDKIVRTMAILAEPVLHARVKLTMLSAPAVDRPAVAEAVLDVNGDLVRAHVGAASTREAADLLERRLRDRLVHRHGRRGVLPTDRPSYVDRPVQDRELLRHKTYTLRESTPEEAVSEMETLDYDFHLFRDLATGEDSVVWRNDDGDDVTLRRRDAPVLTLAAAVQRLNAGRERFVFFADAETGGGKVAYRRYDGHYGLITPLDQRERGASARTTATRIKEVRREP